MDVGIIAAIKVRYWRFQMERDVDLAEKDEKDI